MLWSKLEVTQDTFAPILLKNFSSDAASMLLGDLRTAKPLYHDTIDGLETFFDMVTMLCVIDGNHGETHVKNITIAVQGHTRHPKNFNNRAITIDGLTVDQLTNWQDILKAIALVLSHS
jgi:hypothetical protein